MGSREQELDRIWNLDKCERCEAMESRLQQAIDANESLKRGLDETFAKMEDVVIENKRLQAVIVTSASFSKWGKA